MIVTRISGLSLSDLYALVTDSNWELGMPQTLLHFDGVEWNTERVFTNAFIQTLSMSQGRLYALDFDGSLYWRDESGEWGTRKAPFYAQPIQADFSATVPVPQFGYRSLAVAEDGSLFAAGRGGALFTLSDDTWTRIETGTSAELHCVASVPPWLFACGALGTFLLWDGAHCNRAGVSTAEDLWKISQGIDGSIYVTGTQTLIAVEPDSPFKWRVHPSPTVLYGVAVISDQQVYACAENGLYRWDGSSFQVALTRSGLAQVERIGESVVVGGEGDFLIVGPSPWRDLAISSPPSY